MYYIWLLFQGRLAVLFLLMEIFGYLAAILIGLSLGLIGGGGSILTVPVLVYLFGLRPDIATSYSLFIVGSTSLVGAYRSYLKGLVDIKTALLFGLTSVTTVFVLRKYVVPIIPEDIISVGSFHITKGMLTMVLFATLMLLASFSMIRSRPVQAEITKQGPIEVLPLILYGIGIGLVTGLLGAGGGFLLIPTLVLILKLDMKRAIGTSLFIIALNSLIGFCGDIGNIIIDWYFLLQMAAIAIAGIFLGGQLGKKIPGAKLKKGFGWFVLVMGSYILLRELVMKG